MYPNVKNTIGGLDNWVSLTKGIDLNEMVFNHIDRKPRRYIIVRKKIEDRPKASGKLIIRVPIVKTESKSLNRTLD